MGRCETSPDKTRDSQNSFDSMDSDPNLSSIPELPEKCTTALNSSEEPSIPQTIMSNAETRDQTEETTHKTTDLTTSPQNKMNNYNKEKADDGKIDVMTLPNRIDIVWRNIGLFAYLHILSAYGLYLFVTGQVMWKTFLWTGLIHCCGIFGITAGAHRYWSHKSFKAKLPLKLILVFMQTASFQNSIWEWSRDHRVHHKYSETVADPHNAKRGFFFAHMGWLLCRKHPAVKEKGKQIDLSDLESEPLVMFQKKYYVPLVLTCSFFMPALVPWYFWGESTIVAWCFASQLRYCFNLHVTWLVNSAAHLWGERPYDRNINPAENKFVTIFAFGEGWHNYHHTFSWDYKTAELGLYKYNFTTAFIDFFAWIGWAYDLKTVSNKMVRDRARRTGDGSWQNKENELSVADAAINAVDSLASRMGMDHGGPWGWGDKDIPFSDAQVTQTLYPMISLHED